ncbi:MAG TPA: hypothetical protein VHG28_25215 [Longimicrobiaceae bacterium]|nr:hypothetical protein [Longimicrobiaceae bacterium]
MRHHLWKALVVALGAGTAFFGWKTVAAVASYATAPGLTEIVAAEGEQGFRLPSTGGTDADYLREIAEPGRAVVFVFSPECGACNDNMWNWVDVVHGARDGSIRFFALGVTPSSEANRYWAGLARRIRVVQADPKRVHEALRVESTPTTLLVRNGVVVRAYVGPLTPLARRHVLEFVGGATGEGA